MELRYRIILHPAPEGGYTVTVPSLPGRITEGDTFEEALAMANEAIELYVETLKEQGGEIPNDRATIEHSLDVLA